MNQTFSPKRFGLLLRTYFVDNRSALLANVAVLTVVHIVAAILVYRQVPASAAHNRYLWLFLVGGCAWYVFTVLQVTVLSDKDRAIAYLLRPASQLEKWLQFLLISSLGFLVVYMLLFTLIDAVGVWYVNHRVWSPDVLKMIRENFGNQLTIEPYYRDTTSDPVPKIFWVSSVFLHPVALACALLIRRYALPLIPVIVFCVIALVTVLNIQLLFSFVEERTGVSSVLFGEMFVAKGAIGREIKVPQTLGNVIHYGVGAMVVLLLYATAYFQLKEREV